MKNALDILTERDFIDNTSDVKGNRSLKKLLGKPTTIYAGFDATAKSLHLGHLTILRTLSLLQKSDHKVIVLMGGGTSLVGDPTDRMAMRKVLTLKEVQTNSKQIKAQIQKSGLLKFTGKNAALILNNYSWLSKAGFVKDFVIKIAPLFSVNTLVKMKTFAERLGTEKNLSLLEFIYPILQAWDFLHLFEKHNCRIQVGGSDQWANIIGGVDLIRRKHNAEVFAITNPLLVTSDGKKMGKTDAGPIWLDSKLTSPFVLYQEIEKTPDELVGVMFKRFTDLSLPEIGKIMSGRDPRQRQQKLAYEIVKLLHGAGSAKLAMLDATKIFQQASGKTTGIPKFVITGLGMALDEILLRAKILPSKNEVKRRAESGGIRIDDQKIDNPKVIIKKNCLIRAGKKEFVKVEVRG
jgi:tyrosyl-tRNA synthetase